MQTLIIAFIVLSFVIISHELGHYLFARFFGVKVFEFSVGFGKTIWQKEMGETMEVEVIDTFEEEVIVAKFESGELISESETSCSGDVCETLYKDVKPTRFVW